MLQTKYPERRKIDSADANSVCSWHFIARKILDDGMASMISDTFRANSKVVLLGASGQLGHMCRLMWPVADDLICHSRRERAGFVSFDQRFESAKAREVLRGARAVICLSGVTPRHAKQSGDAFSLNSDLALAAVRASHDAGAGRIFLVSSAAVYGRASGVLVENGDYEPVSDYGRAKLEMEHAALQVAADLGQKATVLRIGNVAGADAILGGWREGMTIDELPKGQTPSRSYIGPETLARVIHRLTLEIDLPDILNITAPGAVEMGALLDAAALPWIPRTPSDDVIEKVELSTKRLEDYVEFSELNSTTTGLVAEWRRFLKARNEGT